jgi:hypothetical protein
VKAAATEFEQALDRIKARIDAERAVLGDLPAVLAEMISWAMPTSRSVTQAIAERHRIHQFVLEKPTLEPRLSGELKMIRIPEAPP